MTSGSQARHPAQIGVITHYQEYPHVHGRLTGAVTLFTLRRFDTR